MILRLREQIWRLIVAKLSKDEKEALVKHLKSVHKADKDEIEFVTNLADKEGGWDPAKVKKWYTKLPAAAAAAPSPSAPPAPHR